MLRSRFYYAGKESYTGQWLKSKRDGYGKFSLPRRTVYSLFLSRTSGHGMVLQGIKMERSTKDAGLLT